MQTALRSSGPLRLDWAILGITRARRGASTALTGGPQRVAARWPAGPGRAARGSAGPRQAARRQTHISSAGDVPAAAEAGSARPSPALPGPARPARYLLLPAKALWDGAALRCAAAGCWVKYFQWLSTLSPSFN